MRFAVVCVALMTTAAGHVGAQTPLKFTTFSLPAATVGSNLQTTIGVTGGTQPFRWKLSGGKLPPGLKLDTAKGLLSGAPTEPGVYNFDVRVTDSSAPPVRIQCEFRLVVTGALAIDWKRPPVVNGQKLEGSVIVSNSTGQDFRLTVIVMAVNEMGRATTLGYQKFTLQAGAMQAIPFGSSPGPGSYVVHADAVAEVAATNSIYRDRKQTADPLVIQAPE